MKTKGRRSKNPGLDEFNMQYYILNKTASDCAKIWGVTENTVYRWAREYKIYDCSCMQPKRRGGVDKKRILSA